MVRTSEVRLEEQGVCRLERACTPLLAVEVDLLFLLYSVRVEALLRAVKRDQVFRLRVIILIDVFTHVKESFPAPLVTAGDVLIDDEVVASHVS